jgi:hypothetical protein
MPPLLVGATGVPESAAGTGPGAANDDAGVDGSTSPDSGGGSSGTLIAPGVVPSGDSSPDSGTEPDSGGSGAMASYLVRGLVTSAGQGLAGVTVGHLGAAGASVTTDPQGSFNLAGVGAAGDGIVASLPGYVTGIWPLTPSTVDDTWLGALQTPAELATFATAMDTTFPTGTAGALHFLVYGSAGQLLAGVKVMVSTGNPAGYVDGTSVVATPAATTTSGEGYVFGIPPGEVDVAFSIQGLTCARLYFSGWPKTSSGGTTAVPIQADVLTGVSAQCVPEASAP